MGLQNWSNFCLRKNNIKLTETTVKREFRSSKWYNMDAFYVKTLDWTFYERKSVGLSAVMALRSDKYPKRVG